MPTYSWKGVQDGKYATGRVEGINRDEAAFKVKQQKVIITSLTRLSGVEQKGDDAEGKKLTFNFFLGRKKKVPVKELVLFTKKLETMMRAGLPVLDTMKLITDQIDHKAMKIVIETILNDVETGIPLSDCFAKHPHVFDNIYINLLRAGETSGKLDVFLAKLVEGIEKEQKIRTSIKGAMTYPTILLLVAIGVIAVMMIYVVPVFQQMFEGVAGGLPVATRLVITISEFFRDPLGGGLLVGAIVASIVGLKLTMKQSYKFRRLFHGFVLKLPLFGELVQKSSLAKLAMVQGNLSSAGVPVLEALDICATAMSNIVIQEATNDVKRGVFSGEPLSDLFKKTPKIFPSTFYSMVSVGEQTGNMEEMFESISRYYEEEMDATIERLTSMLEPVMIVFLGATIGFILVAMYTPMFQVGQTL